MQHLATTAKRVLTLNWREDHTVPSPHLYPHQWSWDSAFITIGYAHYDTARAMQELGFHEYFNPITGAGLGSSSFSWTAALLLDLLTKD